MIQQVETRTIKRSRIHGAPYNPRKITEERLARLGDSMREFGLVQDLVWNGQTGNLVGGHQRLTILDAENLAGNGGDYDVSVKVVDLPLDREKILNLKLNSAEIGGLWDNKLLEDVLAEFEEAGYVDLRALIVGEEAKAIKALDKERESASDKQNDNTPKTITLLFLDPLDADVTMQAIEKAKAKFALEGDKIDAVAIAVICRGFLES